MICSDYGVGMPLFYDFPVVYASGLGFSMRLLSKNNGCKYEI